jgi:hypothetical protein
VPSGNARTSTCNLESQPRGPVVPSVSPRPSSRLPMCRGTTNRRPVGIAWELNPRDVDGRTSHSEASLTTVAE